MHQLFRDPLRTDDIYAVNGSTRRKIRGLDDLREGKGEFWNYGTEMDIAPMPTDQFNALQEKKEIVFAVPDGQAQPLQPVQP